MRPVSAHSRDRETFVCVKFVLQAFTAVLRREPRRPRKSKPIAITTHALPNRHWPDVLIIFSTYAAPHARSLCRLPFRESRHGCDLCECRRLLSSNDAFPLRHRLAGPWSWTSIRRHSSPILPLAITSPSVSILMAVVAVPLSDCELRANFYHCIGCRNSNIIVIQCNQCSRAIKIRRD